MKDKALVIQAQKGSKEAFEELVRRYQEKIIKLISYYIRDRNEALDVAQEAFIKAYRSIGDFRGESAFYTWLHRIAINSCKNYLLARSRTPIMEDVDSQDLNDTELNLVCRQSPELILYAEELKVKLVDALNSLPEHLMDVFILREFEGLNYEEISRRMGCPVGTVRSRISRAKALLREKEESFKK